MADVYTFQLVRYAPNNIALLLYGPGGEERAPGSFSQLAMTNTTKGPRHQVSWFSWCLSVLVVP